MYLGAVISQQWQIHMSEFNFVWIWASGVFSRPAEAPVPPGDDPPWFGKSLGLKIVASLWQIVLH